MMSAFIESNPPGYMDRLRDALGRNSTAEEQAWPLVFLNSDEASYVNGIVLFTDFGMTARTLTGQLDTAALGLPPRLAPAGETA
jgi:hypothetical protein